MKAAIRNEQGKLEVQNVPEPEMGPDRIKVKIAYCGICGSELHSIDPEYIARRTPMPQRPAGARPRVGGHEASGTIVEIGSDVKGFTVGQKVAMNFRSYCGSCYYCRNMMEHYCQAVIPATGSYAEYAVYHKSAVYALPDGVSLEVGALLEPVSVAVHTIDIANIKTGDTVAIMGAGPIGLLIQELALKAGAAKLLVSEPAEGRRNLAKQLGATVVVDPINEDLDAVVKRLTNGRGFDVVIDASGKIPVAKQCLSLADKCGTIVWAAMYPNGAEVGVPPSLMYDKELTIRGVFVSPYSFERALNLLPVLNLEPLISIMPIEQIDEAFHMLLAGKGVKVLIKP
jgi:(R,R)-butanediol dehydrogenase / meso-butanediol dehydrogenase / diacetyl reductase